MKHIIKRIFTITFIAFILIYSNGCKTVDFGNINQDPNQTTEPITSALLTNTLAVIQNSVWDQGGIRTVPGYYAQYFSQTQYTEFSRYSKTATNMDGTYAGILNDLQVLI